MALKSVNVGSRDKEIYQGKHLVPLMRYGKGKYFENIVSH
jgi:hypothetical protein